MDNSFKEILSSMLVDLDKGKSVEEIIIKKAEEFKLNDDSLVKVNNAVDNVDKIETLKLDLNQAISKGVSRQEWLEDRTNKMVGSLPCELQDKAENIIEKIIDNNIKNLEY